MEFRIQGATSGNFAEADINNNLLVHGPAPVTQPGYLALAGVVSDGTGTEVPRWVRRIEASDSFRLRLGFDAPLLYDGWHGISTNIDTNKWQFVDTTFTGLLNVNGWLMFNTVSANAGTYGASTGSDAALISYRSFNIWQDGGIRFDVTMNWQQPQNNTTFCYIGLTQKNATLTVPTDGVYFHINPLGVIQAVLANNNTSSALNNETRTIINYTLLPNVSYQFTIVVDQNGAVYYINQQPVAYIATPLGANGPTAVPSQYVRLHIGTAPSGGAVLPPQVRFGPVCVTQVDTGFNKPWAHSMCAMGGNAVNTQPGFIVGVSAGTNLYSPTAAPGLVVPATTLGANGLGGYMGWLITLAVAETDLQMFAYLNPNGTVLLPGKTLYVTGLSLFGGQYTAGSGATTWEAIQYGVMVTNILNTATVTDTASTLAPRRFPVGFMCCAPSNVVGASYSSNLHSLQFTTPIVVPAGYYLFITLKHLSGTASGTTDVRQVCYINGYFD